MSFGALRRVAVAPIDAFGAELGFPLGKLSGAADVEPDIVEHRLRSRARGNAMPILIRPHIGNLSVRRSTDRKSQHVTGKILESFAIRHADADLHDIVDCRHGRPSFRSLWHRVQSFNSSKRSSGSN